MLKRVIIISFFFALFNACSKSVFYQAGIVPGTYLSTDTLVFSNVNMYVYDSAFPARISDQKVISDFVRRKGIPGFNFDYLPLIKNPGFAVNYIDTNHLTIINGPTSAPVDASLQSGGARFSVSSFGPLGVPTYVFAQLKDPLPAGSVLSDECYTNNCYFSRSFPSEVNNRLYKVFMINVSDDGPMLSINMVTSWFEKANSACSSFLVNEWGYDFATLNYVSSPQPQNKRILPGDTLVIQTKIATLRKK